MARYIDADKFAERIKVSPAFPNMGFDGIFLRNIVLDLLDNALTSDDVAPKSEVDRLVDKWIGEENLTQDEKTLRLIEALRDEAKRYERYYFNHEYDKLIAEAKQEVAREIFEEIERCTVQKVINQGKVLYDTTEQFAELKKKYIGE